MGNEETSCIEQERPVWKFFLRSINVPGRLFETLEYRHSRNQTVLSLKTIQVRKTGFIDAEKRVLLL